MEHRHALRVLPRRRVVLVSLSLATVLCHTRTPPQDFYNLVDVYMDAVFHPKCIEDEQTFQQEGWHLELEDPKDELTFKGVVFNEMKGVYSSPDSVNGRITQQALFPDNSYAADSGGDPVDIPNLSFDEFKVCR